MGAQVWHHVRRRSQATFSKGFTLTLLRFHSATATALKSFPEASDEWIARPFEGCAVTLRELEIPALIAIFFQILANILSQAAHWEAFETLTIRHCPSVEL